MQEPNMRCKNSKSIIIHFNCVRTYKVESDSKSTLQLIKYLRKSEEFKI